MSPSDSVNLSIATFKSPSREMPPQTPSHPQRRIFGGTKRSVAARSSGTASSPAAVAAAAAATTGGLAATTTATSFDANNSGAKMQPPSASFFANPKKLLRRLSGLPTSQEVSQEEHATQQHVSATQATQEQQKSQTLKHQQPQQQLLDCESRGSIAADEAQTSTATLARYSKTQRLKVAATAVSAANKTRALQSKSQKKTSAAVAAKANTDVETKVAESASKKTNTNVRSTPMSRKQPKRRSIHTGQDSQTVVSAGNEASTCSHSASIRSRRRDDPAQVMSNSVADSVAQTPSSILDSQEISSSGHISSQSSAPSAVDSADSRISMKKKSMSSSRSKRKMVSVTQIQNNNQTSFNGGNRGSLVQVGASLPCPLPHVRAQNEKRSQRLASKHKKQQQVSPKLSVNNSRKLTVPHASHTSVSTTESSCKSGGEDCVNANAASGALENFNSKYNNNEHSDVENFESASASISPFVAEPDLILSDQSYPQVLLGTHVTQHSQCLKVEDYIAVSDIAEKLKHENHDSTHNDVDDANEGVKNSSCNDQNVCIQLSNDKICINYCSESASCESGDNDVDNDFNEKQNNFVSLYACDDVAEIKNKKINKDDDDDDNDTEDVEDECAHALITRPESSSSGTTFAYEHEKVVEDNCGGVVYYNDDGDEDNLISSSPNCDFQATLASWQVVAEDRQNDEHIIKPQPIRAQIVASLASPAFRANCSPDSQHRNSLPTDCFNSNVINNQNKPVTCATASSPIFAKHESMISNPKQLQHSNQENDDLNENVLDENSGTSSSSSSSSSSSVAFTQKQNSLTHLNTLGNHSSLEDPLFCECGSDRSEMTFQPTLASDIDSECHENGTEPNDEDEADENDEFVQEDYEVELSVDVDDEDSDAFNSTAFSRTKSRSRTSFVDSGLSCHSSICQGPCPVHRLDSLEPTSDLTFHISSITPTASSACNTNNRCHKSSTSSKTAATTLPKQCVQVNSVSISSLKFDNSHYHSPSNMKCTINSPQCCDELALSQPQSSTLTALLPSSNEQQTTKNHKMSVSRSQMHDPQRNPNQCAKLPIHRLPTASTPLDKQLAYPHVDDEQDEQLPKVVSIHKQINNKQCCQKLGDSGNCHKAQSINSDGRGQVKPFQPALPYGGAHRRWSTGIAVDTSSSSQNTNIRGTYDGSINSVEEEFKLINFRGSKRDKYKSGCSYNHAMFLSASQRRAERRWSTGAETSLEEIPVKVIDERQRPYRSNAFVTDNENAPKERQIYGENDTRSATLSQPEKVLPAAQRRWSTSIAFRPSKSYFTDSPPRYPACLTVRRWSIAGPAFTNLDFDNKIQHQHQQQLYLQKVSLQESPINMHSLDQCIKKPPRLFEDVSLPPIKSVSTIKNVTAQTDLKLSSSEPVSVGLSGLIGVSLPTASIALSSLKSDGRGEHSLLSKEYNVLATDNALSNCHFASADQSEGSRATDSMLTRTRLVKKKRRVMKKGCEHVAVGTGGKGAIQHKAEILESVTAETTKREYKSRSPAPVKTECSSEFVFNKSSISRILDLDSSAPELTAPDFMSTKTGKTAAVISAVAAGVRAAAFDNNCVAEQYDTCSGAPSTTLCHLNVSNQSLSNPLSAQQDETIMLLPTLVVSKNESSVNKATLSQHSRHLLLPENPKSIVLSSSAFPENCRRRHSLNIVETKSFILEGRPYQQLESGISNVSPIRKKFVPWKEISHKERFNVNLSHLCHRGKYDCYLRMNTPDLSDDAYGNTSTEQAPVVSSKHALNENCFGVKQDKGLRRHQNFISKSLSHLHESTNSKLTLEASFSSTPVIVTAKRRNVASLVQQPPKSSKPNDQCVQFTKDEDLLNTSEGQESLHANSVVDNRHPLVPPPVCFAECAGHSQSQEILAVKDQFATLLGKGSPATSSSPPQEPVSGTKGLSQIEHESLCIHVQNPSLCKESKLCSAINSNATTNHFHTATMKVKKRYLKPTAQEKPQKKPSCEVQEKTITQSSQNTVDNSNAISVTCHDDVSHKYGSTNRRWSVTGITIAKAASEGALFPFSVNRRHSLNSKVSFGSSKQAIHPVFSRRSFRSMNESIQSPKTSKFAKRWSLSAAKTEKKSRTGANNSSVLYRRHSMSTQLGLDHKREDNISVVDELSSDRRSQDGIIDTQTDICSNKDVARGLMGDLVMSPFKAVKRVFKRHVNMESLSYKSTHDKLHSSERANHQFKVLSHLNLEDNIPSDLLAHGSPIRHGDSFPSHDLTEKVNDLTNDKLVSKIKEIGLSVEQLAKLRKLGLVITEA